MTTATATPETKAAKLRTRAAPAATATLAAVSPNTDKALFATIETLLQLAWETEEQHECSGESDRLLSIAARLAGHAAADETQQDSSSIAYDIAACINAARLVPGDTESPERTSLIKQAAAILTEIAENTVGDIIRTNVPRPALPGKQAKHPEPRLDFMHFDAFCYLGCALAVLELHAESERKAAIYGLRDLLRVYHDKADEKRGEISQRDLDDLSAEIEIVQELVCHALERSELDSVVLHAVDYLLRDAKEIADGERFQLKEVSHA